jgi:hypothetical protein
MTWRWKVLDHVGSPPPFFDPAEVEVAMMRGNAAVVPPRGVGEGISKVQDRPSLDRRGTYLRAAAKRKLGDRAASGDGAIRGPWT